MFRMTGLSLYFGSHSIPILFAEVIPIVIATNGAEEDGSCNPTPFTNFGVKQFLLRETQVTTIVRMTITGNVPENQLFIRWKESNKNNNLSRGYIVQNRVLFSPNNDDDVKAAENEIQCPRKSATTTTRNSSSSSISISNANPKKSFPLVYIPSDDPTIINCQPCCIIAYAYRDSVTCKGLRNREDSSMCYFTEGTLVRILPPRLAINLRDQQSFSSLESNNIPTNIPSSPFSSFYIRRESMLNDLLGEEGNTNMISDTMEEEVLQNHNKETINELHLKLSTTMTLVRIGTTCDAFRVQKEQERQLIKMKRSIQAFRCDSTMEQTIYKKSTQYTKNRTGFQILPSLIVHSPNHADGKTLLVQAIAKRRLKCSSIHMIRPSALLAKYGIRADAALESQLHAILMSAACRQQSICIILDQIDTMMPPRLSGRSSSGDSALPVLNAVASYFRRITTSLQQHQEWPFPAKNPLYNPTAYSSSCQAVFTVNVCLVGIVTCPDDGWRSSKKSKNNSINNGGSTILDCMVGDRYRIPLLTSKTIVSAFHGALTNEGIILEASAETRLSSIVASAAWAKGSVFRRVASQLKQILMMSSKCGDSAIRIATLQDLEEAIALVKTNVTNFAPKTSLKEHNDKSTLHFASIGGNEQAKISLEDALAFDPVKRGILSRFGLSPPTGVLLYGPPGCGKTILAKAVARMLDDPSSGELGGTFISLSVSEIVSAEVGTSEKMIASSFEFAGKNAPSVIFLDEFQALFTDRNRGGSGKLTSTLLQCLDDIKRWYQTDINVKSVRNRSIRGGKRVIVIGATNTPWMIDCAFLRPGRFDRVVHVGLPSLSERQSILLIHISRMRVRDGDNLKHVNRLCEELSILTEGFSGADIAALGRAAAVRALEEGEESIVEESHFKEAIEHDMRSSSDETLVQRLKKWRP